MVVCKGIYYNSLTLLQQRITIRHQLASRNETVPEALQVHTFVMLGCLFKSCYYVSTTPCTKTSAWPLKIIICVCTSNRFRVVHSIMPITAWGEIKIYHSLASQQVTDYYLELYLVARFTRQPCRLFRRIILLVLQPALIIGRIDQRLTRKLVWLRIADYMLAISDKLLYQFVDLIQPHTRPLPAVALSVNGHTFTGRMYFIYI